MNKLNHKLAVSSRQFGGEIQTILPANCHLPTANYFLLAANFSQLSGRYGQHVDFTTHPKYHVELWQLPRQHFLGGCA